MDQAETESIRAFLAKLIDEGERAAISVAADHFGVSRQTIHKHLSEMVAEGILEAHGRTSGRRYRLKTLTSQTPEFQISDRPAEDRVWREYLSEPLSGLPHSVRDLYLYGFTEMFNNAVEHSSGATITVVLRRTYLRSELHVHDDGVGIFKKIKDGLDLADEREAILELAKGKVTTDPASHTGEGVFFTSRMFDDFSLLANGLFFCHKVPENDWLIDDSRGDLGGTLASMEVANTTTRTTKDVFDRYSSYGDVPSFDKTDVPVKLLLVGDENLVSRSQAKRLLARFSRFREVVLDFDDVNEIGQAFADEVFRVFRAAHPQVNIETLHANDNIRAMIKRAQANAGPPDPQASAPD